MDFRNIDDVKVEKEKAMMRYRRLRNIAKVLRLLEVCVALTILSWWSTRFSTAVRLSGEYLLQLFVSLSRTHIVFLIGNAIVVALFLLSRQNGAGNNGRGSTVDLYEEYVQSSETGHRTATVSDEKMPATATAEEMTYHDEQMVLSGNAVTKSQCDTVDTAIKQAKKEIRRFQRTQSEKFKQEIGSKPRRELRRSETNTCLCIVPSRARRSMSSFNTVDDLSDDEFQRTIDAFIAERQRFLLTQKVADENQ